MASATARWSSTTSTVIRSRVLGSMVGRYAAPRTPGLSNGARGGSDGPEHGADRKGIRAPHDHGRAGARAALRAGNRGGRSGHRGCGGRPRGRLRGPAGATHVRDRHADHDQRADRGGPGARSRLHASGARRAGIRMAPARARRRLADGGSSDRRHLFERAPRIPGARVRDQGRGGRDGGDGTDHPAVPGHEGGRGVSSRLGVEDVQVGGAIPVASKVVRREDVKAYADASGDQNPLHQDDAFARGVGFPGIIAHGMFTMAHVVKAVTDWVGDPGALVAIDVQFRAVVFMDETLEAGGEVTAVDPDTSTATLSVWASVERDGKRVLAVKNSRAQVRLS